jgi:UDP-GlcNAc:undecaprenyl-phosphate GlcNAc-1-phosphate transferase
MGLLELPFGWLLGADPLSSLLLTVGWIVIVTNAFNLMDGMDGLASGISVISLLTVFLLANQNGATVPVIGALALSGALAGFLRFNVPPARVFLGDAGSMGVGYATAVLALASYQKGPAAIVLIVPLMVLGVPLLDTVLAIARRVRNYVLERDRRDLHAAGVLRAIASADRGHIHHLLLRMGLSVSQVLAVLYAAAATLAALGVATREADPGVRWGLWLGLIGVSYGVLSRLEQRVARREAAAQDRDAESSSIAPAAGADVAKQGRQHVTG